jgi:hypothetical protein
MDMGGHKLIHGYSAEYLLFLTKQNHVVFNQASLKKSDYLSISSPVVAANLLP